MSAAQIRGMGILQPLPPLAVPRHGGDLARAQSQYPQIRDWLDLSAALNPQPWPVPAIPAPCFQRLPEGYESLLSVAADYYRQRDLWPLNGSQQGIESLPRLFQQLNKTDPAQIRVAVPAEGYQEHAWCWQKNGFQLFSYRAGNGAQLLACAGQCDVLVVINPNNPTGQQFDRQTLLACHKRLAEKGGWLVVDEAFIDAFPEAQQAELTVSDLSSDSLIVLRSIGKFFGLAGIRSGFMLAGPDVMTGLKQDTGPWPVSGVTAWLTEQMLADKTWQQQSRQRLARDSVRLQQLLGGVAEGVEVRGVSPLFVSLCLSPQYDVLTVQQQLAAHGIWLRGFPAQQRLRLGLPGAEADWQRLSEAWRQVMGRSE